MYSMLHALKAKAEARGLFNDLNSYAIAILAALGFFVVFNCTTNVILNQVYISGAARDTLLYSTVYWRNGWNLDIPGIYLKGSFFRLHISWIMWLPSFASYLFPVDRIPYMAGFMGFMHAMIALGMFLALQLFWPARHVLAVVLKVFISMAFAVNPNALSILSQAHIEIAGVVCGVFFLLALVQKRYGIAALFFALAMGAREDLGFHLFGLLFLVLLLDWLRRMPSSVWRPYAIFALAGFAYTVLALCLIQWIGDYGNLRNVYTGKELFSHLTQEAIHDRLHNLFVRRTWIWVPAILSFVWAVMTRNYYIATGYASCIPWTILSLMAQSDAAAFISVHYGFPYMTAAAWTIITASRTFMQSRDIAPARYGVKLLGIVLVFFVSQQLIIGFKGAIMLPRMRFLIGEEVLSKPVYDDLENRLNLHKEELGTIRVDNAVKAIAPYAFDELKYLTKIDGYKLKDKQKPEQKPEKGIDTIIKFSNSFGGRKKKLLKETIKVNGLRFEYELPGTKIILYSRYGLENAPSFKDIFVLVAAPALPAQPPPPEPQMSLPIESQSPFKPQSPFTPQEPKGKP